MPSVGDRPQRKVGLLPAVASKAVEHVAGQTLAVDPDESGGVRAHLAHDQRNVVVLVDDAPVRDGGELAVCGRHLRLGDPLDHLLVAAAVGDDVGDGDDVDAVLLGEVLQLRHPCHRAVVVHDLADDAGRVKAGHPGEVDDGLGLPGPHQHAAVGVLQRETGGRDGPGLPAWSPDR